MGKEDTSGDQKTLKIVEEALEKRKDIFELSSGVVLKTKAKINPSVIIDILSAVEKVRPEAPVIYIENLDREEINYDDPEYVDRLGRWETVSAGRIADALILLGTEIKSIPKGVEKPEGNAWIETLEVLGFKLNRRSTPARYLAWVKHVAIQDQDDWEAITENVGRMAGVTEADVKRAQSSFPGKES